MHTPEIRLYQATENAILQRWVIRDYAESEMNHVTGQLRNNKLNRKDGIHGESYKELSSYRTTKLTTSNQSKNCENIPKNGTHAEVVHISKEKGYASECA